MPWRWPTPSQPIEHPPLRPETARYHSVQFRSWDCVYAWLGNFERKEGQGPGAAGRCSYGGLRRPRCFAFAFPTTARPLAQQGERGLSAAARWVLRAHEAQVSLDLFAGIHSRLFRAAAAFSLDRFKSYFTFYDIELDYRCDILNDEGYGDPSALMEWLGPPRVLLTAI